MKNLNNKLNTQTLAATWFVYTVLHIPTLTNRPTNWACICDFIYDATNAADQEHL